MPLKMCHFDTLIIELKLPKSAQEGHSDPPPPLLQQEIDIPCEGPLPAPGG